MARTRQARRRTDTPCDVAGRNYSGAGAVCAVGRRCGRGVVQPADVAGAAHCGHGDLLLGPEFSAVCVGAAGAVDSRDSDSGHYFQQDSFPLAVVRIPVRRLVDEHGGYSGLAPGQRHRAETAEQCRYEEAGSSRGV